ncbi:MAG: RluA family pseudouridine synthase [Clostridiaceae bacterium]|nr:RluA family pseudouridine synthase [Clostridiaceae bacterium]
MSEGRQLEIIVEENETGLRLDAYLAGKIPDLSRSYIQRLINDNLVLVNGESTKGKIKTSTGMKIVVNVPEPEPLSLDPENIPLDIVYEDSDILVINKPRDMVVHPAPGNRDNTLVNALLYHCRDSLSNINGVIRPGIVHRIDKDTTGLIAVAKNNNAHQSLAMQLKDHSMERIYDAIVEGIIHEDRGTIDAPIGRHPVDRKKMAVTPGKGKNAVTHFEVLERLKGATYVRLRLKTGRTHQIRVHMSYIRHPVYGDPVYGGSSRNKTTGGQMLHARYLRLKHPSTGEFMEFEAKLPEDFIQLLNSLRV